VSEELDKSESLEVGMSEMPSQEEMGQIPTHFSKGIVFYMRNNSVVGVVLWNVFNRIPIARRVSCTCNCK
jgi:programmed cell death 8 (apoptosis-inducing factor)